MATLNDANTLEAHVEKIVLAVCALIVIVAAAYWLVGSPRAIEGLPPDKIDQSLAAKAGNVQILVDGATPPLLPAPDYPALLASLQQAPKTDGMVDLAMGNLPLDVSGVGPVVALYPTLSELVGLVPPTLDIKTEAGGDFRIPRSSKTPLEIVGADLQIPFPLNQLQQAWESSKLRYVNRTLKRPVILSVEMECQEQEGPGKPWSKPEPFKSDGPTPAGADGKPLKIPALPKYDGTNGEEVVKAVDAVANLDVQKAILHPPYFDVLDPATQTWGPYRNKLTPPAEGNVAAWAFRDNLLPNRFYRYRMRLHLLNPLYGHKEYLDVEKSKDMAYVMANAGVPSIATDWSAWSAPVSVPRTTQFFLTGSNPSRGWVRVTVITRHMGQLVMDSFNVAPGQLIGGSMRITKGKQSSTVDFNTGAVVIAIDFSKTIYKRGVPTRTVEMIYRSQDNKLKSRLLAVDEREFQQAAPAPKPTTPPAEAQPKAQPNNAAPPAPGAPAGAGWQPAPVGP
ncbi:MAG: hypothetical protein LLG01_08775 [Planctomycetaceae bacterium]|nr:hypothetical protein [Planctomycetaceae bacterium]